MNASTTLDIRSFIDERRMSANQWALVVLGFLIVAMDGMDVAIMGFVAPSITGEWHVSRPEFGFVMGAAPIGLAIGAIFAGSSSDWIGRRKVLLGSVLGFGLLTIATAYTTSLQSMAVVRLLAGLGLGAAMPNTSTLLTEYVPVRNRSFIVATMFTGFNFGSGIIGFVAASLIPAYGWQSVLLFGGIVPLVMLPVLFLFLPESARFMAARGFDPDSIRKVLARVCKADLGGINSFETREAAPATKQPLAVLFAKGYALRTASLWITYFMGLLVIYLTTSWLPTMMKDAGIPISRAAQVTGLFQIGGTVGAIVVGFLMDKLLPNRAIALSYFLGGISLILLGTGGVESAYLALLVAIVGFFLSGGQTGLNAFAPNCYPTIARATGTSWMLGVGRLGSILGSSIGGLLLATGWGFGSIFVGLAIPAALAALAILFNKRADT
jgi:AAHS family 4-hydroxybenzoate transporter-like MFS transporter